MSAYSQYELILSDRKLWNYVSFGDFEVQIETLFNNPNTLNFIKMYMFYSGKVKVLPWGELSKNENLFEDRAPHTISLFLFGILVVRHLGINFEKNPNYFSDSYENFLYLWSAMCLYHDIGYLYENQLDELVKKCPTVSDFNKHVHIKFNLLDNSDDRALAEKYYNYRWNNFNRIDHGIAGGLLMYDRLMKDIFEHEELHNQCVIYFGDTRRFSETNKDCAKIVSSGILRHNMWFANKASYKDYERAGLNELLPKPDKSHKYCINDNALLFLLCLLDTLEPFKIDTKSSYNDILKGIDITFSEKRNGLTISVNDGLDANNYFKRIKDLEDWLGVKIDSDMKRTATIQIL